jgi:hypothetical protein
VEPSDADHRIVRPDAADAAMLVSDEVPECNRS